MSIAGGSGSGPRTDPVTLIRDAGPADVPAITDLTNALIATTTYEWRETPYTVEDRRSWLAAKTRDGMVVHVAEAGGQVVDEQAGLGQLGQGVDDHPLHILVGPDPAAERLPDLGVLEHPLVEVLGDPDGHGGDRDPAETRSPPMRSA